MSLSTHKGWVAFPVISRDDARVSDPQPPPDAPGGGFTGSRAYPGVAAGWKRLAGEVKRRRIDLGLRRQRDLADLMGIDVRVVNDIETNRRTSFSVGTMLQLAKALKWDDDYLFGITHNFPDASPVPDAPVPRPDPRPVGSSLDAAADAAGLSDEERQAIITLINARKARPE